MDSRRPTLPHLLDIANTDLKPESSYRRPGTTNSSNETQFDFPKSAKTSPWGYTQSSFKPKKLQEQKLEKEIQDFCFSTFRTPQKALPKLYTAHQYETMSHKYNDLKQRYRHFYKKSEGAEVDQFMGVMDENIKDIYLEAEKMFSGTYSVKYFGVQGDELGIASKRLTMSQSTRNTPTGKKNTYHRKNISIPDQKQVTEERKETGSGQTPSSKKLLISSQDNLKSSPDVRRHVYNLSVNSNKVADFGVEVRTQTIENELKAAGTVLTQKNQLQTTSSITQTQFKPYPRNESIGQLGRGFNEGGTQKRIETKEEDVATASGVKKSLTVQGTPRNLTQGDQKELVKSKIGAQSDPYVVTKYLLPKKLQAVKKPAKDINMTASQTHRLWGTKIEAPEKLGQKNSHSNASTHRAVIQEQQDEEEGLWPKPPGDAQQGNQGSHRKTSSLDKKLSSMEKAKRNLLRSINVERVWEARPYRDELDIPEKFQTYEVKKVMADSTKYSYAKLLETMHTNERPEAALIENTQKMQKILSVREEKRNVYSKTGKRNDVYGEVDKKDMTGNYVVKVMYPKENEMFNRFCKIKHNVMQEKEKEKEEEEEDKNIDN